MDITAEQLRAARAMLRIEQSQLAQRSGVSVETIKRLEAGSGKLKAKFTTLDAIRRSLEFSGLVFSNDHGPGVRLAADPTEAFIEAMTKEFAGNFRVLLKEELRSNAEFYQTAGKAALVATVLTSVTNILQVTLPTILPGK
jgi:transcriptional regulator with XRE-family HTH domain